ncbi:MAG: cellulase family glycosylhydrolase [Ignavibacteriales bacterium]|nr:cellulase family glycosylhydrolase [Ignavibacteriales bacterium]
MKKIIFLAVLAFLTIQMYPQGFLSTSGKKIVDGNGQEIILRGIGLGGWLVQEGYMLQTSGFANAQWEIRAKIADLIGPAETEIFYENYRKNFIRREDIKAIKSWGFNSIRLPMHYNLLTPQNQPGVWLEPGFAIIDSTLQWCKENQLYLILDLHAAPGGQSANNICDYNPANPSLWEDLNNRIRTVAIWNKLAARYANEPWIGGYDVLNETAWNLGSNNAMLRQLMVDITNAIRLVDNNHIIFVEGNWYATDFNGLTPKWDSKMAYSFHKYWNVNNTGAIQYLLDLRTNQNAPLWLGESGENSNQWFTDCIELMENNSIGWAWWTMKKLESTSGLMSIKKPVEFDQLLKYWSGQARA